MMEHATTVEKALDLLVRLHGEAAPRGVSELGRALRLPKSTAHRLLGTLARRGFVERDERGRWRPGFGLIALGLGALEREPVVVAARPVLEELAAELGETLFLAAARAGRLLVLEKEEGVGFLRASPRVGTEVPLHATAVGKLHLAFAPDVVRAEAALEVYTPRTRSTPAALTRELARVRTRGFATNREEWLPELAAVAAPVWLAGRLVAGVAAAGPTSRIDTGERGRFVRAVRRGAERIGARLEGRSS